MQFLDCTLLKSTTGLISLIIKIIKYYISSHSATLTFNIYFEGRFLTAIVSTWFHDIRFLWNSIISGKSNIQWLACRTGWVLILNTGRPNLYYYFRPNFWSVTKKPKQFKPKLYRLNSNIDLWTKVAYILRLIFFSACSQLLGYGVGWERILQNPTRIQRMHDRVTGKLARIGSDQIGPDFYRPNLKLKNWLRNVQRPVL